jgi:hypothetical protein
MFETRRLAIMGGVPCFLVEIRMNEAGKVELERAVRTLEAAQTRLRLKATATRTLTAGVVHDDGQLVCLIEAPSLEAVRRLVSLALLPRGRIREITEVSAEAMAG